MLRFYLLEEYRRHAYIARKFSLFIFPVYIVISTLFAAYFLDYIFAIIPYPYFIKISLISSFIYGFGVSSFEFLGRSEEKFTLIDASMILPVSPRKSYLYVFLRDTLYYSLLFVLPLYAGLLLGTIFTSLSAGQVSVFVFSIFLSMWIGYSLGYLSFSLEGRSKFLYYALLAFLLIYLITFFWNIFLFPPEIFQRTKNILWLIISIFFILLFTAFAYFLAPTERRKNENYENFRLSLYQKLFKNVMLAKVMEDTVRGRIIVKSLFTYFFPMLLLFIFIKVINKVVSTASYNSLSLSIVLSLFSVVIYSWLTIMDDHRYMGILPVSASQLIYTLIKAYLLIISLISIPIIITFNLKTLTLLPASIALFYLNSLYLTSVVARIAGYRINSMLFNPGIVFRFSLYTFIPGVILLVSSIELNVYSFSLLLITICSMLFLIYLNLKKIKEKWLYF